MEILLINDFEDENYFSKLTESTAVSVDNFFIINLCEWCKSLAFKKTPLKKGITFSMLELLDLMNS